MKDAFCLTRVFLAAVVLLVAPSIGRSQIALTFVASDATYSQVTVTASGSWADLNGDPFGLLYTSLSLDGFSAATGLNASAGPTTLSVVSELLSLEADYDTLTFDSVINPGIYLESSANSSVSGGPYDFSGSAVFDLSSLAGQIAASGEIEAVYGPSDSELPNYNADIGTWTFEVAAAPEPGTVALGCLGVGILAFALRRRLTAA
jgi:hypothetical protein